MGPGEFAAFIRSRLLWPFVSSHLFYLQLQQDSEIKSAGAIPQIDDSRQSGMLGESWKIKLSINY
jgi:hypothetical protein